MKPFRVTLVGDSLKNDQLFEDKTNPMYNAFVETPLLNIFYEIALKLL